MNPLVDRSQRPYILLHFIYIYIYIYIEREREREREREGGEEECEPPWSIDHRGLAPCYTSYIYRERERYIEEGDEPPWSIDHR